MVLVRVLFKSVTGNVHKIGYEVYVKVKGSWIFFNIIFNYSSLQMLGEDKNCNLS